MLIRFALATALLLPGFGMAQEATADTSAKEAEAVAVPKPRVTLRTSLGDIIIELEPEKSPKSVENFLQYVEDGHYNGTIFHRVIDGFMAQGGGFTADLQLKPTRAPIENEANNGLSNLRGTVAMARTNEPHSALSQFFINVVDNPRLDFVSEQNPFTWGYAVFGTVVEGMDVVDRMRAAPTGPQGPFAKDVPTQPIVIERAERLPPPTTSDVAADETSPD